MHSQQMTKEQLQELASNSLWIMYIQQVEDALAALIERVAIRNVKSIEEYCILRGRIDQLLDVLVLHDSAFKDTEDVKASLRDRIRVCVRRLIKGG